MAAFDQETLDRWRALAIVDRDGSTVGTISEFYLDRETGYPTWALVSTGLFGASRTFVPLVHATEISDGLQVPYEKSHIKDAPRVDLHDELSPDEEAALFAHYGVEYQPSTEAPEAGPGEGPGPVLAAGGAGAAGVAGVAGPPSTADAEVGSGEPPGPVATEPGSDEAPGSVAADSVTVEATAAGDTDRPAAPDPTDGVPPEPGTDDATGRNDPDAGAAKAARRDGPDAGAANGAVPDEPGTTDPDPALQADPEEFRSEGSEQGGVGSAFERRQGTAADSPDRLATAAPDLSPTAPADPDLSRTAPVEPGLPGSTAASRYGPVPTTVDKGADPTEGAADGPFAPPVEAGWAPGAAGSFEQQEPTDRPMGSGDRWREDKLAAQRDRVARPAPTQPEDRSPLERARRRLERLVGGGQEPPDPEPMSPADRDAAERARRARLGLDEDDNRRP